METSKIYNNDYYEEVEMNNSTTENNEASKEEFLEGFINELAKFILEQISLRQIISSLVDEEEKRKYLNERKDKIFAYSISVSKNSEFYTNYIKHLLNYIKYNTARRNIAAFENPYLNLDVNYLINSAEYLVKARYILEKFNITNIYCNSYGTVTLKFSFNLSKGLLVLLNAIDTFACDRDGYFKYSPITLEKLKRYKLECIIEKIKKEGIKK